MPVNGFDPDAVGYHVLRVMADHGNFESSACEGSALFVKNARIECAVNRSHVYYFGRYHECSWCVEFTVQQN